MSNETTPPTPPPLPPPSPSPTPPRPRRRLSNLQVFGLIVAILLGLVALGIAILFAVCSGMKF